MSTEAEGRAGVSFEVSRPFALLQRRVGGLLAVGTLTHERSFSQAAVGARNGRLATPYAPEYVEMISANFGRQPN